MQVVSSLFKGVYSFDRGLARVFELLSCNDREHTKSSSSSHVALVMLSALD